MKKITRSDVCKVGCSVAVSVAIILIFYGIGAFSSVFLNLIGSVYDAITCTSNRVGLFALMLVAVIIVGLLLRNNVGFAMSCISFVTYVTLLIIAIFDSHCNILIPQNSLGAMLPSFTVMIALVLYYMDLFTFCDKLEK
jgi:hypothetical protein